MEGGELRTGPAAHRRGSFASRPSLSALRRFDDQRVPNPAYMTSPIASIYDVPVLKTLAEYGAVPLQVLTYHLASRHDRDTSHLLCVVRSLARRGLLTASLIEPRRGAASRRVAEITYAGLKWLQQSPLTNPYGRSDHPRGYQIARATIVLHYLADGHRLVGGLEVYDGLRGHAVATIRTGHDREAKGQKLDFLKKAVGYDMRMEALFDPTGAVTLIMPVYPELSWSGILRRLTMERDAASRLVDAPLKRSALMQVASIVPLKFLLIAPDVRDAKAAERGIRRWAQRWNIPTTVAAVPPWMLVGFPLEPPRPNLLTAP